MDEGAGQIRQDVREIIRTRTAMTEKLEQLEHRLQETVEGTRAAALDVVDRVRDTAEDLMTSATRAVDPVYQTRQHPWIMLGAAIAAGFLLSRLMKGDRASGNGHLRRSSSAGTGSRSTTGGMMAPIVSRFEASKQAVVEGLLDQLEGELARFRAALIEAGQTFIRGLATQALDLVSEVLDPSRRPSRRPSPTARG